MIELSDFGPGEFRIEVTPSAGIHCKLRMSGPSGASEFEGGAHTLFLQHIPAFAEVVITRLPQASGFLNGSVIISQGMVTSVHRWSSRPDQPVVRIVFRIGGGASFAGGGEGAGMPLTMEWIEPNADTAIVAADLQGANEDDESVASRVQPYRSIEDEDDLTAAAIAAERTAAERSVASPPVVASDSVQDRIYTVWYGTDRTPKYSNGELVGYSASRGETLRYGKCDVLIPESHVIGSRGSSLLGRVIKGADDRLKVRQLSEHSSAEHWREIRLICESLKQEQAHAVMFLHGYRTPFDDAVLQAAQIGCDLNIPLMAAFSWPSRGKFLGYLADGSAIESSERAIADYIVAFARSVQPAKAHIIAHSMGNRGLLRAINRIVKSAEAHGVSLSNLILAAPDVDVHTFKELASVYAEVCARTTLYASERDIAVKLSRFLHSGPRAGFIPPITVVPGIDTVVVTGVDLSLLGHGYIASQRPVLSDVFQLIVQDAEPGKRMGLRKVTTNTGDVYWEFIT